MRTNRLGALAAVAANQPRFDFDPLTLACRGVLIEPAATNLVVGSDAPATQNITVTAQQYTISIYGTGSVTLSGAYAGTLTGASAYPTRTTLTFTAAAGTLTLTPSSAARVQLETGPVATSYMPTAGSAVTRVADQLSITGADFARIYRPDEITVVARGTLGAGGSAVQTICSINDGGVNNRTIFYRLGSVIEASVRIGGVSYASLSVSTGVADNAPFAVALSIKSGGAIILAANGTTSASTVSALPPVTRMDIGHTAGVQLQLSGVLSSTELHARAATAAELVELTR